MAQNAAMPKALGITPSPDRVACGRPFAGAPRRRFIPP